MMTWDLLTLDPGTQFTGAAIWKHGRLVRAAALDNGVEVTSNLAEFMDLEMTMKTIVEGQYINKRKNIDLKQILDLSYWAGAYSVGSRPVNGVERVLPVKWKGSVPKMTMCARIIDQLDADEIKCIESKYLSEIAEGRRSVPTAPDSGFKLVTDILDAVGIGLWHYGRL